MAKDRITPHSQVSLACLAEISGYSTREIAALASKGAVPRDEHGAYQLGPAMRAIINHKVNGGAGDDSFAAGRRKLTQAKADIEELRRGRMAGELVPREDIEATWAALVTAFRSHMLAIPTRLAARIGMVKNIVEAQELMRKEIEDGLSELSKGTVRIRVTAEN